MRNLEIRVGLGHDTHRFAPDNKLIELEELSTNFWFSDNVLDEIQWSPYFTNDDEIQWPE